ncbi:MAG: sulfite exporter TauE/SafE family protein [Patescibacteria group bacterium]
MIKEKTFKVEGMHCASCELVIEKKLLTLPGVQSVEASVGKSQVVVEYEGKPPPNEDLNKMFLQEKYTFFDQEKEVNLETDNSLTVTVIVVLLVIMVFIIVQGFGLPGLINVNKNSSLLAFFVLGLAAGVSSCAALVGGLVLSLSKQWFELYSNRNSTIEKLQPHFLFNTGRILSYALFGAALGLVGNRLEISFVFTSFLVIAVSVLMFLLGLEMLGIRYFQKFQITMPKAITRYVADGRNFKGRYMPFLVGAMTFFLPCGFTLTAYGFALLSGSMAQGALIMLAFVLGTLSGLLAIGLSGIKLAESHRFSTFFPKAAGALVLFFALYNLNNQFNVLGISSLSDFKLKTAGLTQINGNDLAPIVAGKQIIKMDASGYGYQPNYFKVQTGIPIRWEITDKGTSGCTNAVISRGLFDGQISLTPGQVSVKEFVAPKPGRYKFSCWMGMISGTIEVVDKNGSVKSSGNVEVPSGARGCGCGGSGGSSSCQTLR